MYCIECETIVEPSIYDGSTWHYVEVGYEYGLCDGVMTSCPPPELPEDWELFEVEPEVEFMVISNANAEGLLLEFQL